MKRCIIITGYIEGSIRRICPQLFSPDPPADSDTLLLCADGGYRLAKREGLIPHVIIGDFDTFDDQKEDEPAARHKIIRVPAEKDDSDTMLCIKYGIEQGCDSFLLVGGMGGRLDHTVANLQALAYLISRGKPASMQDEATFVTLCRPGSFTLCAKNPQNFAAHPQNFTAKSADPASQADALPPYRYFSLFSWSPVCRGVSIEGAKYPMENGQLSCDFPLGLSNEFQEDHVQISLKTGLLLVIMSRRP